MRSNWMEIAILSWGYCTACCQGEKALVYASERFRAYQLLARRFRRNWVRVCICVVYSTRRAGRAQTINKHLTPSRSLCPPRTRPISSNEFYAKSECLYFASLPPPCLDPNSLNTRMWGKPVVLIFVSRAGLYLGTCE
jgi:hypothetical protein